MANDSVLAVLQAAAASLQAGEAAALLTIVRASGSTPRRAGAKLLLRSDGSIVGTIGGGAMEEAALADARAALASGQPMLGHYDAGSDAASLGLCGGNIEVSIEVLQPAPRLLIIGAGHIARPLATMATLAGMDVTVVDDRPDWATPARFPSAVALHTIAYDRATETLAPLPVAITPATAVVVATWGWDEPALRQVLPSPAYYVGLVGSRRKRALLSEKLLAHGVTPQQLARLRSPIGLDLGGETPGEIALAILAEIQLARSGHSGRSLSIRPE